MRVGYSCMYSCLPLLRDAEPKTSLRVFARTHAYTGVCLHLTLLHHSCTQYNTRLKVKPFLSFLPGLFAKESPGPGPGPGPSFTYLPFSAPCPHRNPASFTCPNHAARAPIGTPQALPRPRDTSARPHHTSLLLTTINSMTTRRQEAMRATQSTSGYLP